MSKEKMINENELEKISGGKGSIWLLKHTSCRLIEEAKLIQKNIDDKGNEILYCPKCKGYFPKKEWKAICQS